jgi:predicted DNA-binding transcriptional regulator AlpA
MTRSKKPEAPPQDLSARLLLSFTDLKAIGIPYHRSYLYRMIKDKKFPKPIRLGEGRVAFPRDHILAYINNKIKDAEV